MFHVLAETLDKEESESGSSPGVAPVSDPCIERAVVVRLPPYGNCTYSCERGRAVSMKPPMPRQFLQLLQLILASHLKHCQTAFVLACRGEVV